MKTIVYFILISLFFQSIACAERLFLYPIGDSITSGVGSTDGFAYRAILQDSLKHSYDFVGPYRDPDSSGNYDVDHEGVSGERTDEIDKRVNSNISEYMQYVEGSNSVAVIHAGTNDLNQDYGSGTYYQKMNHYVANVANIINIIDRFNPCIQTYVCLIVPSTSQTLDAKIVDYNAKLKEMVNSYPKPNLYLVDMYSLIHDVRNWENKLMADALHPNDAGYALMGKLLGKAINARFIIGADSTGGL